MRAKGSKHISENLWQLLRPKNRFFCRSTSLHAGLKARFYENCGFGGILLRMEDIYKIN